MIKKFMWAIIYDGYVQDINILGKNRKREKIIKNNKEKKVVLVGYYEVWEREKGGEDNLDFRHEMFYNVWVESLNIKFFFC